MRFVNLQTTSERVGKGQVRQLLLRRPIASQSATLPVLAFGDADTGLFQSADDVLEFATAGVSRFKVLADGTVAVAGNLVVNGTTTTVNSTTLTVDDKNIELGSVATPSDTTADGGGITLKGATDKTFNWVDSTDAWTSSEHINLASGKTFQLNGTAITSTAAELNLLSSVSGLVQADLTKLAAVDASATELNYTDGVTSAIQTQLDAKAPIASPTFTGNFTSVGIDDNADATAITIDSSENVGIGTTAPYCKLDVRGGVEDPTLDFHSTGYFSIGANVQLAFGSWESSPWAIWMQTRNATVNGSSYPLAINPLGGNVGIGTAAPDAKLTITNAGANSLRLKTTGVHGTKPYISFDSGLAGTNYAEKARITGGYDSATGGSGGYFNIATKTTGESLTTRFSIDSSGHITPGTDNTQNLGSTTLRWANFYVGDMHFSNEGKEGGNEVDGSTGNWTIQEGDENLFVINRKTGKKFKMNLTEV